MNQIILSVAPAAFVSDKEELIAENDGYLVVCNHFQTLDNPILIVENYFYKIDNKLDGQENKLKNIQFGSNIIDISDRNFNPVNDYHNHSVYTYVEKEEVLNGEDVEEKQHYRFVESRYPADVLRYGEITTAQTSSDGISSAEAYNRTKLNEKYGDNTKDSLTVTVIGYPSILNIDDNVECILEDDYYNDIKAVKSIEVEYDVTNAPKIQTTLGLNKISPTLQLKKSFEKERAKTKNKDIIMKQTALFDVNETFYWEE